ncbi:uncharacterized protein LOC128322653 isoform X2 [Hemicordylus capensis]|uniref:uncharacterized protein LOC128322653 isoform X2 n=1 Tax=Hemicordylus capensis TaxID=884348 RepID=UPI00230374A8|nr:uncharacterized protein LOC128322653 isoform X2 [Hemicordylus capensis]
MQMIQGVDGAAGSYAAVLLDWFALECQQGESRARDHSCFKELKLNFIDFHPTLLFASQIHSRLTIFSQTRKTSSLILTDGPNYKGRGRKHTRILSLRVITYNKKEECNYITVMEISFVIHKYQDLKKPIRLLWIYFKHEGKVLSQKELQEEILTQAAIILNQLRTDQNWSFGGTAQFTFWKRSTAKNTAHHLDSNRFMFFPMTVAWRMKNLSRLWIE